MKYYSAIKKNNAIRSNMDGPRDCHTEWSQRKAVSYDITYMWNLKKMGRCTNKLIYKTEVESRM